MHYRLGDIPRFLCSPLGRRRLLTSAGHRAWPLLAVPAALYRRTLVRRTRVIAVAGSFGKTTTARAVLAALGHMPSDLAPNYRSFLALTMLRIRPGQRRAVLEVGIARRDEMAHYARVIRPDVAVVTSIGSEHHRSLGTLEEIRAEKSHIVRVLPPAGTAVLNGDDPNVRWMREQTRARVTTFGFGDANDIRASAPVLDWPRGMHFQVATPEGTREVRVRLIGRPMVYPILAAITVAREEGIGLDAAIAALEHLEPTRGRLQPVPLANGVVLLCDEFKSAEETIDAALDVLEQVPASRRVVVLGDVTEPVGKRRVVHRRLGERVGRVASRAIFVTDSTGFKAYRSGARRGGLADGAVLHTLGGVRPTLAALGEDLGEGDVVLIKGRHSQRLERVALALTGRQVRCELTFCDVKLRCDRCPMLERG